MKSAGFDGLRLNPRQEANLLHMHRVIDRYLDRLTGPAPTGRSAGPMDFVNLGATGLRVSRVCLGMMSFGNDSDRPWVLDEDAAEPIVRAAVEAGINFFDTADMYSSGASEVATGRLVPKYLSRDEAVIATKVFMPMTPGPERRRAVAQAHPRRRSTRRCSGSTSTTSTSTRSTAGTRTSRSRRRWTRSTRSCASGKARYIGASSMHAWQFAKAQHVAERHGCAKFVSMQNHYNLLYREEEREMIPQCLDQGIGVIPWSPLARGVLAGNRTRGGEKTHDPRRRPTRSPTTSTTRATSTWSTGSPRSRRSAASRRRRSRWRGCCTGPA